MAEPTDPAALVALKAYDDASHKLSSLQDNLPDMDEEGTVDAWVMKAQIQWQIAAKTWEAAEVTDRAWHRVEQTFMKILPEVCEKSLRTMFVEYNELAEHAVHGTPYSYFRLTDFFLQFDFDVVPLPILKSLKQCSASSIQRAGSHVAASPAPSRQKSLVLPLNLVCQATLASQTPKLPVLPADPPHPVSPVPVPPKSASPLRTPPQMEPLSVVPLLQNVLCLRCLLVFGGNNSGWGSPAWSTISLTDDTPPSPSGGYIFFPPDQTSSLHYKQRHPFKIGQPTNAPHTKKPTHPLRVVDGIDFHGSVNATLTSLLFQPLLVLQFYWVPTLLVMKVAFLLLL
ncbi:hypothetical protein ARMSODRAFT_982386 [Armillaria solidipes]|uniref:Uncharacterized protein n=1 Tax=Armillaria solidipes TaxID=1076256 RepID=A0A2H3AN55_9AGAR|nr:hypothetical protein ARMSODRAFT_982386 [Armillaria solidipes]